MMLLKDMALKAGSVMKLKPSKEQLLCMAVTFILAAASCASASGNSFLKNGSVIERGEPGSIDRSYEVNVRGLNGNRTEKLSVKVSAREYTEEEAAAEMESLMESLSGYIAGENENLDRVTKDLELKKSIPGFGGIRLSWFPEDTSLISYNGEVHNLELEEPKKSSIRVVLRAGEFRKEYAVPVTVYPAEMNTAESKLKKLSENISDADMEQINSETLVLPDEVAGNSISYGTLPDMRWLRITALGILAFVLLGLKPEQNRKKKLKMREDELLLDYSGFVSKLVIYMGAGMTARNAWIKIADNYGISLKKGAEERAAYDEIARTAGELEKGVPESRAFSDFAERCSLNCYLKLVSLLEQNRRTGDSRSESALLLEAQEAFEQRKNIARRLGEEAGTKLMIPLIISLVTVMIIVAVPAMMTLA